MATPSSTGRLTTVKREAVIWRWLGTRPDIVRVAHAVQEATATPALVLELTDALGTSEFNDLSQFEQELEKRESLKTVAIIGEGRLGLCKTAVVFDAAAVHTKAAVTVISSGVDPRAVDQAHATALRVVSAGEREPKGVRPAEIEKWAGVCAFAAPLGVVLLLLGGGNEDAGLALLASALILVGTVGVWAYLGYEAFVPQVELLRPGQKSRFYGAVKWLGLTIAGIVVTGLVTGVIH